MSGDRLIKIMQNVSKPSNNESTDLLYGDVVSVNPLKIKIDNRFIVDEKFLILSALVKETRINIPDRQSSKHYHVVPQHTTSVAGFDSHSHAVEAINTSAELPSILLWRGLIVGDKVRLLRIHQGDKFYVLEREEGIT